MKTKSLFFAALFLISAAVSAAGKDERSGTGIAIVHVKGSETFKLVYKGESAGKVTLNIFDKDQTLIMTRTFKGTDGFICPLNFNGLAPGEYTIEVIDADGSKSEKVVYGLNSNTRETVFALNNNTEFVHVSKIDKENGKYLLSVAQYTGAIKIRIFDAQNNLIYSDQKKGGSEFAQIYKLEEPSRAYTFEVSDNFGNVKSIKL